MRERKLYHTKREYIGIAFSYQPSEQMRSLLHAATREKRVSLYDTARRNAAELSRKVQGDIPTEEYIRAYSVRRDMFLNPLTQTKDTSQHNLLHATATEVLSTHIATVLNADPVFLNSHHPIDVVAEAIAGSVHDTKRLFNSLESAVNINAHGRRAAGHIGELVRQMGQDVALSSLKTASTIVRYHDAPVVPQEYNTAELQVFKLADSLGMVRFVLHPSRILNNLALQTVEDKLLSYQFDNPSIAQLASMYVPIALALYALSDAYMTIFKKGSDASQQQGKQYQVESVIRAAQDLGLLSK